MAQKNMSLYRIRVYERNADGPTTSTAWSYPDLLDVLPGLLRAVQETQRPIVRVTIDWQEDLPVASDEPDPFETALPTTEAIASEVHHAAADLDDVEGDEGTLDIRLQVVPDEGWYLHYGLADYDTNHRGYWGATTIGFNLSRADALDVARDLIAQVRDAYAQDQ